VKRNDETTAEADGWFTVSRAAALLGVPLPRIFDQIRDGKLQVRFEPGDPGKSDHPLVTSAELKQRKAPGAPGSTMSAGVSGSSGTAVAPLPAAPIVHGNGASALAVASAAGSAALPAASAAADRSAVLVAQLTAQLEESRRATGRLEGDLREARGALDEAEDKLDASLKAIYDRDVQIARLEAESKARELSRQDADSFIRHLEVRLDKTEERSEEKEKEIRRLAVGLGEARGEIKMLKPPAAEPPSAWRRQVARVALGLMVIASAGAVGWVAYALGVRSLQREAGIAAGAGALLAFGVGSLLDRLRKAR